MEDHSNNPLIPSVGHFRTVFLTNSIHGEVDPFFYDKYKDELGSEWEFHHEYGSHFVNFNKDSVFPLLTEGWADLKILYGMADMEEIVISYHANNNFRVHKVKPLIDIKQIPIFHSRAMKVGYTAHFCLHLTKQIMNKPYLSIFGQFEEYVRLRKFNHLIFCCDNGTKTQFQVASTDEPFKTTALGTGWHAFCNNNDFKDGDHITFKFSHVNPFNVVHVFEG